MTRHNCIRRIATALTLTVLVFSATAEITPEARTIIDAYNSATGGTEAKNKISIIHYRGQWEMPQQGIKGSSHLWIENKKSFAMILDIPEFGTMKTCSSQGISWTEQPTTGVQSLDKAQAQHMAKAAILFPEIEIDQHYESASVQESSDLDRSVLLMVDKDGREETWVFDNKTSYLIEVKMAIDEGVRGRFTMASRYGDYREVEGVFLPNLISQITPVFEINITTEKIELNPEIPNHIFQIPDELKSTAPQS